MRRLVCRRKPTEHGGRVVFDEDETHYCVECNGVMMPEDDE